MMEGKVAVAGRRAVRERDSAGHSAYVCVNRGREGKNGYRQPHHMYEHGNRRTTI